MSNEEIFKKVNSILIELGIISEETDKDTDLFNECGLSSVSVIDIIVGLEETFDISLDSDDDMLFDNYSSIAKIADLVRRKNG
jgi:acyl carrier protein